MEKLRTLRSARLRKEQGAVKRGVGDHFGARRITQLYERALARFSEDVALWIEFVEYAKRQNAKRKVAQVYAKALELHSTQPRGRRRAKKR